MSIFGRKLETDAIPSVAELEPLNKPQSTYTTEMVKVQDACEAVSRYYQNRQQDLRSNSVSNPMSGAGGPFDKSGFFSFLPHYFCDQRFLETMCVASWAADRFVSMPVDDMFTKPREYDDDKFRDYSMLVKQDVRLASAMRTARKFGTGLLWAVTREADPTEPLDVSRVRPDDLSNLLVFDRFSATVGSRNNDINSVRFGEPEYYQLFLHGVGNFTVHASRVYRFDGLRPDTSNGWQSFERDWGISNLSHALVEIFNDSSTVQAVNHLVQEASIPVQKVQGLTDILCSQPADDEMSVDERLAQVNMYKSIYRTLLMDSNDTFERVGISFAGIPDLLDKFSERLAMMTGISATRFLGRSPDGMNATGAGDLENDNRTTRKNQTHILKPAYNWLDPIVAASAGTQIPDYIMPPLNEPTAKEESEVGKTRAETSSTLVNSSVWDEDEAKYYVSTGIAPTEDS